MMRCVLERIRGALLHAFHLIDRHPQAVRHDKSKRKRIVTVLQAFFRGVEQLRVQIEIEFFSLGQQIAMNLLQLCDGFRKMFLPPLDTGRRVVAPARILPGIADAGRDFGIFVHPSLPVGIEIGAEFPHFIGLRVGDGV